ncbi:GntR family transcriptional regulator [Teichococcus oryzae]|uniref:FCD domain-containing protein n=1 Tax=Teichococcus oryzae TaxID=1608942 RepID=A0A5B2TDY2_9PROT|nr:GntR family transcriptional regulator [Pseudoroseomonas oryzae]KAA2212010.1 FCD domain-containing protein [Pseudoroseomonas oryzae]
MVRGHGVDAIARRIEDMILQGEVLPGERLNELALSRRLDISRASLREAARGLEQTGLLEIIPNRGVLVRQVSMKDALDLYDLRAALFRAAARLAARRATPQCLLRLQQLNEQMRDAASAQRFADYYGRNLEFHTAIMAAGGNAPMARTYDQAVKGLHLFRRRSLLHPAQLDLSLREHEDLLAAISIHDAAAAGDVAERHIMLGRDRMLDTLEGGMPA